MLIERAAGRESGPSPALQPAQAESLIAIPACGCVELTCRETTSPADPPPPAEDESVHNGLTGGWKRPLIPARSPGELGSPAPAFHTSILSQKH